MTLVEAIAFSIACVLLGMLFAKLQCALQLHDWTGIGDRCARGETFFRWRCWRCRTVVEDWWKR